MQMMMLNYLNTILCFFANDDAELSKYNSLFLGAIKDANNAENLGRYGDTPNVSVGWCP